VLHRRPARSPRHMTPSPASLSLENRCTRPMSPMSVTPGAYRLSRRVGPKPDDQGTCSPFAARDAISGRKTQKEFVLLSPCADTAW
jgi:hypothetical protein